MEQEDVEGRDKPQTGKRQDFPFVLHDALISFCLNTYKQRGILLHRP
jgi:hypothetical protein